MVRAAWREYRIAAGFTGGTGRYAQFKRAYVRCKTMGDDEPQHPPRRFSVELPFDDIEEINPPRWFMQEELGFSWDHAGYFGSFATMSGMLPQINQAALSKLKFDAPYRVTYPKNFKDLRHDSRARRGRRAKVSYPGREQRGESMSPTDSLEALMLKYGLK